MKTLTLKNCELDVSKMGDEDLRQLHHAVWLEQENRLAEKLRNREFPELSLEEKALVQEGRRIEAIQSYRKRTGVEELRTVLAIHAVYWTEGRIYNEQ